MERSMAVTSIAEQVIAALILEDLTDEIMAERIKIIKGISSQVNRYLKHPEKSAAIIQIRNNKIIQNENDNE